MAKGPKDAPCVGEIAYRGKLPKLPPEFRLLLLCHPKPLGKSQERLLEFRRNKKLPKGHIGTPIACFCSVYSIHMVE